MTSDQVSHVAKHGTYIWGKQRDIVLRATIIISRTVIILCLYLWTVIKVEQIVHLNKLCTRSTVIFFLPEFMLKCVIHLYALKLRSTRSVCPTLYTSICEEIRVKAIFGLLWFQDANSPIYLSQLDWNTSKCYARMFTWQIHLLISLGINWVSDAWWIWIPYACILQNYYSLELMYSWLLVYNIFSWRVQK